MSEWPKTAEVVIIGGGIMGASTAYHLAKRDVRGIVLLEKDLLAQASTGLSVGGIRQQFSHPANIRLSQESVRVFERFEEEFGVDIRYRKAGYLFLARKDETWREFLSTVKTQRLHGVPVEVLKPEEIQRRWPYLNISDLQGGTFGPEDGYADPYTTAMGFARAAKKLGARIEEQTKVIAIQVERKKIKKVKTIRGSIQAPVVVNVAGAWGGQVGLMAGINLPVKPYRRQVFMTKAFDSIPKPVPMILDQDVRFYFRGEDLGLIIGMSDPDEPSSFSLQVDRSFMEKVIEVAIHRAPLLEKAQILRGWAGLYDITPDDNPIIGESPEVKGFFCAVGFSGHGFQQSPAVGLAMSQLITEGRTKLDLTPFAFDRFRKGLGVGEKRIV